ncbi:phosphate signaling complex protein PhoU [Massilibacterium senegalense]|uniref:phosphate signaling complex protein PhoU n=1 Tax=Massilibacterium senegalense TaxID=1632858 RepID=UPI00078374D4|nr:phosphate signaling complex protein PhoU [Massilibacterium senegalense]
MVKRENFIGQLEGLSNSLLKLNNETKEAFQKAMDALKNHDHTLAKEIIEHDCVINNKELSINEDAILIIAKQQPVAIDLRFIISIIKISYELERMADLAVNISRAVVRIGSYEVPAVMNEEIYKMADLALIMLDDTMEAFKNQDASLAKRASKIDDDIDVLYEQFISTITSTIQTETLEIQTEYAFIARHIERYADHVTNIAEHVVYLVKGKHYDLNE